MLPVQGNVFMLIADGVNLTASIGHEGTLLVNTGAATMTDKVLAALNQLAQSAIDAVDAEQLRRCQLPRHVGLVEPVHQQRHQLAAPRQAAALSSSTRARRPSMSAATRRSRRPGTFQRGGEFGGVVASVGQQGVDHRARERAQPHERARGQDAGRAAGGAWPTDTYFDELHKLPAYFNGEAVIVYHAPGSQYRRRQPRLLPPLRSDQRRRSVFDGQLSDDRSGQGRLDSGRHQRPESDSRPRGRGVSRRRAARGSFPGADGCPTPPTWRPTATCS